MQILPGFELAHGSSSGFCCNQRGFQTFFWLKQLAKILGLALLVFPPRSFLSLFGWWEEECLPGIGAGGGGGHFFHVKLLKSRFPPHTRNQRAGKAPLVRGAKCLSQPALGPENFPLELLSSCAYSGLVLCCCCCFQAVGTLQALFPAPRPPGTYPPVRDGMDFRVLPKKVSSDQPFLGAEVTGRFTP